MKPLAKLLNAHAEIVDELLRERRQVSQSNPRQQTDDNFD